MKRLAVLGIVLAVLTASPVSSLERFEIITTEQLESLLAERRAGDVDFILVNALDEIIYRHHAIPGSINVPWSRVDETADRLGGDKDRLIITY